MNKQHSQTSVFWACTIWLDVQPHWSWPTKCPLGIVNMFGQVERSPSTDRLHYQFYVKTEKKQRLTGVKKILGCHHAHVEPCYKSEAANRAYCSKDETLEYALPELKVEGPVAKVHPIDYLLGPHMVLCYGLYPEAADCGEARQIIIENPARFDKPQFHDWRTTKSIHHSQGYMCSCMMKMKDK